MKRLIFKLFSKEIEQTITRAIVSFHYVPYDTTKEMAKLATDMLTKGDIKVLAERAGMTEEEYLNQEIG